MAHGGFCFLFPCHPQLDGPSLSFLALLAAWLLGCLVLADRVRVRDRVGRLHALEEVPEGGTFPSQNGAPSAAHPIIRPWI